MESVIPINSHKNSESEQDLDSTEYLSILSTSPSKKLWSQQIHHQLAWRVHKYAYETNKRCLVENTVQKDASSCIHCVSRRLEPRRVNALEFAWVSPNFKEFWETFKWFLLPEDHIIRRLYHAAINDQDFPDVGEGPYNYCFVAHPSMKYIGIHRQMVFHDIKTEDLKPEHFMFCSYPFGNIGSLSCHLHPKFVICHIGYMAARADDTFLSSYADAHSGLLEPITMILQICKKWTRPLDKTDPKHLSCIKNKIDPDDIISGTYTRTGNGRIKPYKSKRRLPNPRNGVKHKRKGIPPHFVPIKKLQIFEERISPDILSWRSTVLGEHDTNQGQIDYIYSPQQ